MGTSGFMGLVIDGQPKIGYVHWDSDPTELGVRTLEALRTLLYDDFGGTAEKMARQLNVVSSDTPPTQEQKKQLAEYANISVSTRSIDDWYELLRSTHGDLLKTLKAGYIEDASEFPYDSLFCEYGYLIDFDTRMFEAYEGFQTEPHKRGRFASGNGPDRMRQIRQTYYPCARVGMWSFGRLPKNKDFLKTFQGYEEDE